MDPARSGACAVALRDDAARLRRRAVRGQPARSSIAASARCACSRVRRAGCRRGRTRCARSRWPVYLAAAADRDRADPAVPLRLRHGRRRGSDAHLAAGTAEFLRHGAPHGDRRRSCRSTRCRSTWRSKQAIYYAFAAVSTLARHGDLRGAVARSPRCCSRWRRSGCTCSRARCSAPGSGAAARRDGASRRWIGWSCTPAMHPYFNQTWGYMTMPFAIVLAWWVVRRRHRAAARAARRCSWRSARSPTRSPVPIAVSVLAVMWWVRPAGARARAASRSRTSRWRRWRRFWRASAGARRSCSASSCSSCWSPLWGVFEKIAGATQLLINPHYSLRAVGRRPVLAGSPSRSSSRCHDEAWWPVPVALIAGLGLWQHRGGCRGRWRWGDLHAGGRRRVRGRDDARCATTAGTSTSRCSPSSGRCSWCSPRSPCARVRYVAGRSCSSIWTWMGAGRRRATRRRTRSTSCRARCSSCAAGRPRCPPDASIRLDMQPEAQNCGRLHAVRRTRLCSQRPLDDTAYPHVPLSRAADYVLVRLPAPAVRRGRRRRCVQNAEFTLYRLRPGLPGGDRCSQRMIQTVTEIRRG